NVRASSTGTLLTDVIAPAKPTISGKLLGRVVYTGNQALCDHGGCGPALPDPPEHNLDHGLCARQVLGPPPM
ncbi:hypothetical protein BGZ59_011478, partial [Podila verticillata]